MHAFRPEAISFAQATEVGTVYTPGEVAAFGEVAREFGPSLHMDGARFANAVAALHVPPAALTWRAGVDALSFGGTKNGMAFGEAVIFFNKELARNFEYRLKQSGQLASKMRFLSAQWIGMLTDGAWLRHASHAMRWLNGWSAGCGQWRASKRFSHGGERGVRFRSKCWPLCVQADTGFTRMWGPVALPA